MTDYDRIRKLRALAASTDNQYERDTSLRLSKAIAQRVGITCRSALLRSRFGNEMAFRWFSVEELNQVPRFKRGANSGSMRGIIEWDRHEWLEPNGPYYVKAGVTLEVRIIMDDWDHRRGLWVARSTPLISSSTIRRH